MPGPAATAPPPALRSFGRFRLLALVGKSERTMAWRVADPRTGQQLMLVLPRVQPPDAAALERWQLRVRRAARLNHPRLAPVVEVGVQDGWPFVAHDPHDAATLADRLAGAAWPAAEVALLGEQLLEGLAFAHEGGVAHHDLQPHLVLVPAQGPPRIAGLEVGADDGAATRHDGARERAALATDGLQAQRDAAERDVLAVGLLLHRALCGQAPLDEPDVGRCLRRLPPDGRDVVRLPWGAVVIPEALRAIVNRATDRQVRQRYRNARTLAQALEGWRRTEAGGGQGPLALLLDRLHRVGVLPASPGGAERAARLALMERERTAELAEVVLEDFALACELLRLVNSAQLRGGQWSGNGSVLTVRRAIAMVGVDGVRRAALALRPWPGPLSEAGAGALLRLLAETRRAGRVALALRPAGYDAEVVMLVAHLMNLGRLAVHYHFPDEAQQIRRLMQPAPPARPEEPEEPGMSEAAASFAVLGADIEAIGLAVVRHWGLDDSVLAMLRRQPPDRPVRVAESDGELLRLLASCALEAVESDALPPAQRSAALARVAQRYARALDLDGRSLHEALQAAAGEAALPEAVSGA